MVVGFLLLFLLINRSSPSQNLRISEMNPGNLKTKEIMGIENVPKIPATKRSLGLLQHFINNMIRHIKKDMFLMTKKKNSRWVNVG